MITKSAVKGKDGTIVTGFRHSDAYEATKINGEIPDNFVGGVAGFITDTGEFLDRYQADKHAFDCGQIKEPTGYLISEDLWPPERE